MKIDELKDLLLEHCNTTNNIPVTFVSDENINFCQVAMAKTDFKNLKSDHVNKDENSVPISFSSYSMTKSVQNNQQINIPDNHTTIDLKRRDLTPPRKEYPRQGYTPERHTTKKKRLQLSEVNRQSSDSDDSLFEKMQVNKPISFKHLIKSMDKDESSDSDDFSDLKLACNWEHIGNNGFVELDEPTE